MRRSVLFGRAVPGAHCVLNAYGPTTTDLDLRRRNPSRRTSCSTGRAESAGSAMR